MSLRVLVIFLLTVPSTALAQQAAVVPLIEDDTANLIKQLNNDGGLDATQIRQEFREIYSGVSSLRVTPFQRYSSRIVGWNYAIVENPPPGQYRFLRFAWKREGGAGIMIQLHSNGSWNQRYYSGVRSNQTATWGPMIQVSEQMPAEWTVVTRDLFKDFGTFTMQGFALTPMENGVAGYFDHVYLGRSVEDLDRASAEAFGKTPLKDALTLLELGNLWDDLAKADVNTSGAAVRKLVAGRKESVAYLTKMMRVKQGGDAAQIARWIAALDDEEFAVRENSYRALDKLGDAVIRPLQEARAKSSSIELRSRIDGLLKNRGVVEGELTGEQLRLVRAIRVLEWSGAGEALGGLAKEPPDATLLADIQRARSRLAQLKMKS